MEGHNTRHGWRPSQTRAVRTGAGLMLGRRCKRWPNIKPAPVHTTRDCGENWPCACCTLIDMMCIACVRSGNKEMQTTPPPPPPHSAYSRYYLNVVKAMQMLAQHWTNIGLFRWLSWQLHHKLCNPCQTRENICSHVLPTYNIVLCSEYELSEWVITTHFNNYMHIPENEYITRYLWTSVTYTLLTFFIFIVCLFICLTVMYTVLSSKCFRKIVCSCKQINIYSILFMYDGCHHGTLCMMWYRVRINTHPNSFMKIRLFLSMEKMVQKKFNPLIFYIIFNGYAL